MDNSLEIAYLGIAVPDPSSLSSFFHGVIGLVPGEPADADTLTWRNDDRAHRIIVQRGPANDAVFLGFEASNADNFDDTVARLRNARFDVTPGTETEASARRVARLAHVKAPWGVAVEVVEGLEAAATPYETPRVAGGFLTEGVGFGHVVFATPAFDESHRFLVDGLGFAQSDWLEMEAGDAADLIVRFYHCNERHHSVALARTPTEVAQGLHHFMLETNNLDDTGAAFDRAWASDFALPSGLGRHDNDRMFSFYVQSPAGFQVEVGHGARLIDDNWDDNRRYQRVSAWGHHSVDR